MTSKVNWKTGILTPENLITKTEHIIHYVVRLQQRYTDQCLAESWGCWCQPPRRAAAAPVVASKDSTARDDTSVSSLPAPGLACRRQTSPGREYRSPRRRWRAAPARPRAVIGAQQLEVPCPTVRCSLYSVRVPS